MNIPEILVAAAIAIAQGFLFWERHRERRAEAALNLEPNPERCDIHKENMGKLERRLEDIERDVVDIKGSLRVVRSKLGLPEE